MLDGIFRPLADQTAKLVEAQIQQARQKSKHEPKVKFLESLSRRQGANMHPSGSLSCWRVWSQSVSSPISHSKGQSYQSHQSPGSVSRYNQSTYPTNTELTHGKQLVRRGQRRRLASDANCCHRRFQSSTF